MAYTSVNILAARPGLSIFEALGKLSLGAPPPPLPLETTHTCTLFTMPSAGPTIYIYMLVVQTV